LVGSVCQNLPQASAKRCFDVGLVAGGQVADALGIARLDRRYLGGAYK
jgi:hypothetical protein